MNRVISTTLLFSGILFLIYGFLLQNTLKVQAQQDEREYIGIRECNDCHRDLSKRHELTRHGMTLSEVDPDAAPEDLGFVLGDFTVGEDVRTVSFPDGEERAFELSDVAFALGTGKNYQAYVTSLDKDVYAVLPAMWDVNEGAWVALNRADSWPDPAYDFGSQCAGCHTVGLSYNEDTGIYKWKEDGVQCEACHGPGSLHADLVDDIGFDMTGEQYHQIASALDNPTDAQVCGSCHIRGLSDDGIHPYPIDYMPGHDLFASFSPVASDDSDYWYPDGYAAQSNMQYNEWSESRHASSLKTIIGNDAAKTECLMCHSNIYNVAHRALIDGGLGDPADFALAPLILKTFEDAGLSPSKQQIMLELWLPMVRSALASDETPDVSLEDDVLFPLFDLIGFKERDYDPEAPLLPQFMPYLGSFVADAQEDANDGKTKDLEEVSALMEQLVPFVLDDILSQQVTLDDALAADVIAQPSNFSVSCVSCHQPHNDETAVASVTPYALCTSCHQSTSVTETLHHPVKEMFEGLTIVEAVKGIPSTHFADSDGPTCTDCHMSDILVGGNDESMRANHTWNPVIPSTDPDTPPSACSSCHTDLSVDDLRSLVKDTQSSVQARLSLAWARVGSLEIAADDAEANKLYAQAVEALTFVQNDGSKGVHNYAYTDALLNTASRMLSQLSVPGSNLEPTEAPAPTATASPGETIVYTESVQVTSGMRPITFIIFGVTGLILLGGAWFIFRWSRRTTTSEGDE